MASVGTPPYGQVTQCLFLMRVVREQFTSNSHTFTMPEIETFEDEVGFLKNFLSFLLSFAPVYYVLISKTAPVNVASEAS